jgi:hypothetical protein
MLIFAQIDSFEKTLKRSSDLAIRIGTLLKAADLAWTVITPRRSIPDRLAGTFLVPLPGLLYLFMTWPICALCRLMPSE